MADLSNIPTEELLRMQKSQPSGGIDLSKLSTEALMKMRGQEKPGVVEDVIRSLPGALPRAAAALVGFPQSINELARAGNKKAFELMGIPGVAKFANRAIPGVINAAAEVGLPNIGETVTQGYDELSKVTTGDPVYRPKTGPGRVADLTAQTVLSPGGSFAQKATMGFTAGVSGEGARQITNNPIAIGVIQMLGGAVASLPWILRSVPAENINNAIKDITPEQLAKAQALMDDAAARGVKLTGAEAIAQVTGKNNLQDIQRVVESSKKGGPILQGQMNERPAAVRSAFETEADKIATMPASPSATPARMAKAGEEAITKARQAGNAAAEPLYDQARTQRIGSQDWNAVTQNPASLKALQAVKQDPIWGVTAEREGSVAWMDAAKRWIDDKLRTASPSEARIWQKANDEIKMFADSASPTYAKARSTVAANRQNVVEPMKASPVGDIAATKGMPAEQAMKAQGEVLMPTAPRALDPITIKQSVGILSKQDPTAARDFVRQNLQAIFDESAQNLSGGTNQWGGAKFAAQVAGNPRQRDNLQALVESVGNRQTWVGFNRMLDVMEATGKRHAAGSQTAFNQQLSSELTAMGTGAAVAGVGSPTWALSLIGRTYDNFRFGKNTAEMARILTDPKSVELMTALAKEAPNTAKASALVAQILAAQSSLTNAQPSNTNR